MCWFSAALLPHHPSPTAEIAEGKWERWPTDSPGFPLSPRSPGSPFSPCTQQQTLSPPATLWSLTPSEAICEPLTCWQAAVPQRRSGNVPSISQTAHLRLSCTSASRGGTLQSARPPGLVSHSCARGVLQDFACLSPTAAWHLSAVLQPLREGATMPFCQQTRRLGWLCHAGSAGSCQSQHLQTAVGADAQLAPCLLLETWRMFSDT